MAETAAPAEACIASSKTLGLLIGSVGDLSLSDNFVPEPCPARECAIADAVENAKRILEKIDERRPTECPQTGKVSARDPQTLRT